MSWFAIKQISTGLFIPQFPKNSSKGGTWLEPTADRPPRLFRRQQDAKVALANWLRGHLRVIDNSFNFDPCEGTPDPEWKWEPVSERKAEDMAIIEIEITERLCA